MSVFVPDDQLFNMLAPLRAAVSLIKSGMTANDRDIALECYSTFVKRRKSFFKDESFSLEECPGGISYASLSTIVENAQTVIRGLLPQVPITDVNTAKLDTEARSWEDKLVTAVPLVAGLAISASEWTDFSNGKIAVTSIKV